MSSSNSSAAAKYNLDIGKIAYKNNFEYRAAIRRVFFMNCDADLLKEENPDYDEETFDEELYDGDSTTRALDYVFEKTKDVPLFQKLYSIAAGRMFSESLDLGMAVLFSYDNFTYFHDVLVQFFKGDKELTEDDECVRVLMSKV